MSKTVDTVGELVALLQTLDQDMLLSHRDNIGFFNRGASVTMLTLTKVLNDPTLAVQDNDGIFKGNLVGEPFKAIIIE